MREIKFRVWDKKLNRMVYGPELEVNSEDFMFSQNYNNQGFLEKRDLMQFIGLRDKSLKEIYEGDILECTSDDDYDKWFAKVVYCNDRDYPAFDLDPYPEVDCNAISYYLGCGFIEVIGNIYETPELLD